MSAPPADTAANSTTANANATNTRKFTPCDLAVLTPDLGLPSETFIRRHCNDLLPGRTAAVARTLRAAWRPEGPMLLTEELRPPPLSFPQRLARKLGTGGNGPAAVEYAEQQTERFLRAHGVSVLLGEYLHWCVEQLPLALKLGLPLWAHGHGYDISAHLRNPRYQQAYRALGKAAGVIVMSDLARRRLIDLGLPAPKVHVIAYGTDVPAMLARQGGAGIRCLAVGRMVPKKGIILLLDAFRRAAEVEPTLRLDVVGAGELFPAAQQFVQSMQLANRVTLHGEQPFARVRELLGEADIFMHHAIVDPASGDEEGLPVAILEAMAAALPVVATRHAGIPEAVAHEETGLLSAEGATAEMAGNLLCLAQDAGLRRGLGEAGWKQARLRFSWERERRDLLGLMGLDRGATRRGA